MQTTTEKGTLNTAYLVRMGASEPSQPASVLQPVTPSCTEAIDRAQKLLMLHKRDPASRAGVTGASLGVKVLRVSGMKKSKVTKGRKGKYGKYGHNALGTPRSIMPDEIDVELPFVTSAVLSNTGFAFASYRWAANGLYDPDPNLGGISFIGLAEWAAFFNYYRVISFKYDLEISNQEAFPMFVDIYTLNQDPSGTVGTGGMLLAVNQFGKTVSLGPITGGRDSIRVSGSVSMAAIVGTDTVETSPLFQGNTLSGNAPDAVWFGFNTRSAVVQTAAGVYYTLRLRARTRLYDRAAVEI